MYYLSEIRRNIINWYTFKENCTILLIGVDSVRVTEVLLEKAKKLIIAVQDEEQKDYVEKNLSYKEKWEIISIENMQKVQEKFDYICMIGTLSLYKEEEKAYKKLQELIKLAKPKLQEDGKLLLAVDNKYGMKFWTSIYADKNVICNSKTALSKTMIEEILENEGLHNRKFYYILPDYILPNVIFTDEYLPNIENISRNFTYAEDEFVSYNQTEAYQEILKEDTKIFPFFANSYFVEIGKTKLEENEIKFVSYTNIRKEEYRIKTIIYKNHVEKTAINEKSRNHIEQIKNNINIMKNSSMNTLDSYTDEKIISQFVEKEKSYDNILLEYLQQKDEKKFFKEIIEYGKYLYNKLEPVQEEKTIFEKYKITISKEQKEKLHFVKNGLWDLIFQNAFCVKGELYFYDQEWYEENVPIEFIIYRAITYFGQSHRYITKNKILETLEILEFEELFKELDSMLQEKIRDENMWKMHIQIKTGQTLYDLYQNLQKEFRKYKTQYNEENENALIEKYESEIQKLQEKNQKLLDSTSWRITKPIRFLGKYLK